MINTVAMIFGYLMFCSLVLFCIYIVIITVSDHVKDKKRAERSRFETVRNSLMSSMDILTTQVDGCLDSVSDLRYRIDALEAYIQSTKNTDAVMEDRKEVLTNERISDEHEGQDR